MSQYQNLKRACRAKVFLHSAYCFAALTLPSPSSLLKVSFFSGNADAIFVGFCFFQCEVKNRPNSHPKVYAYIRKRLSMNSRKLNTLTLV